MTKGNAAGEEREGHKAQGCRATEDSDRRRALPSLERTVRAAAADVGLPTATASELVTSLDSVTNARRARLAAASGNGNETRA